VDSAKLVLALLDEPMRKRPAWTESQTIHQGSKCEASRLASRSGPAQHLGSDAFMRRTGSICRCGEESTRERGCRSCSRKQSSS